MKKGSSDTLMFDAETGSSLGTGFHAEGTKQKDKCQGEFKEEPGE